MFLYEQKKKTNHPRLFFFENKENKFKFTFSNNRININTEGADVYLFNCNEDDKFSATVSDNFITSSNKENIVGPNIQGNSDAKLDFDFEKDFQSTPSIPDDKITANSMCSVSTFENSEPEVINDRCSYNGNGRDTTLFVDVIKTKFVGFHQTQSGGALHITNCGVKCKNAQFRDCQANPGGGGAIYIKNTISLSNNVDLENLNFVECQAVFGGAIYVYSDSERNSVNIVKCSFSRNSLISGKGSENGGTALYLTVRKGTVNDCTFSETNKGNMIKISNNYDGGRSAVHLDNHKKDDLLLINGCKFEQSKDADSSIFYESFVETSKLSIINCQFKGKLNNDSHYIEGKFLKENEKNFIVNSCSFEQNNKLAISLKFVNENPDRSRSNYFTFITNNLMVVASILAVLAILAVIVAFIVIRSAKNQKSDSNEKEENETNSIEIDEPVN